MGKREKNHTRKKYEEKNKKPAQKNVIKRAKNILGINFALTMFKVFFRISTSFMLSWHIILCIRI